MELQWTGDLATGIDTIDGQHRELFDAANRLLRACSRGEAKASALDTIEFLKHYTTEHFSTEESLMLATGYDGYEAHKAHHEEFCAALVAIEREVSAHGVTTDLVIRINTLLIHWLGAHIRKADAAMAEHVRAANVALELVSA